MPETIYLAGHFYDDSYSIGFRPHAAFKTWDEAVAWLIDERKVPEDRIVLDYSMGDLNEGEYASGYGVLPMPIS